LPGRPSPAWRPQEPAMHPDADRAHHELIDQIIARGSLWSRPLIAAFRATPRHYFLDRVHRQEGLGWYGIDPTAPDPEAVRLAYSDRALTTHLADPVPGRGAVAVSS